MKRKKHTEGRKVRFFFYWHICLQRIIMKWTPNRKEMITKRLDFRKKNRTLERKKKKGIHITYYPFPQGYHKSYLVVLAKL